MKNTIKNASKHIFFLLAIFIISIPTFSTLFEPGYFSMHDDQHIARLYELKKAIKQGQIFPRWVGTLGFGYGYPLFNFYPPLIYYIALFFNIAGFSLSNSIKAMVASGVFIGMTGIYFFSYYLNKNFKAAFISALIFSFFPYRAVLIYIRGAFAEFYALSILPFIFLSFLEIYKKLNISRTIIFGTLFGLLIVCHPLIAFPTVFYLLIIFLFLFLYSKNKKNFTIMSVIGAIIGLGISAFFWLPSMVEKKYTLVQDILLKELASYSIHFIHPIQFWHSQWGFGGSIEGINDGMSFALGKIFIATALISIITFLIYIFLDKDSNIDKNKKVNINYFILLAILLTFSIFMTTVFSNPIWIFISYLQYLQFPWRFLTFVSIFMPIMSGYAIVFIESIKNINIRSFICIKRALTNILIFSIMCGSVFIYSKYFRPQKKIFLSDKTLTSYKEIAWRVSRSSFEFIPKYVSTKKSEYNTTIPIITKDKIRKSIYKILKGSANVYIKKNLYTEKNFIIQSDNKILFQVNNFYFPGWHATINKKQTKIYSNNPYHLIQIYVPKGKNNNISVYYAGTRIQKIGNCISIASILAILSYYIISTIRINTRNSPRKVF